MKTHKKLILTGTFISSSTFFIGLIHLGINLKFAFDEQAKNENARPSQLTELVNHALEPFQIYKIIFFLGMGIFSIGAILYFRNKNTNVKIIA